MIDPQHSPTHVIRLHGPWSAEIDECWSGGSHPEKFKCKPPCDWEPWLGTGFRGRVRFERPFGMPTNLDPDQAIQLAIDGVDYRAVVCLNGHNLGAIEFGTAVQFSVRSKLLPRNRLQIDIDLPMDVDRGERNPMAGGLIGSIRLEIF